MLWRHIKRWQRSFLFFSAHELEEARDNLTMVSLEMLKLGKEVVGHPSMFLTLVLVAKWDSVSRRDKLLMERKILRTNFHPRECSAYLPHPGYPALQCELSHCHLTGRVDVFVCPEPKTILRREELN